MRWLLGRGAEACHACGAELEDGAAWCGACGARTEDDGGAEQAVSEASTVAADGPADQPRRVRLTLAAGVVLALLALTVAWQLRSPVPQPLLGHLGANTGMSATGPPPDGLQLAWSHQSPASTDGRFLGGPLEVVARGDRVRVGNLVVDAHGGELVGVIPELWPSTGVERTVIDARELLVVDTLSGEVRSRAPLSEELLDAPLVAAHRGRGGTLVRLERDSVLVADDGSLVAEVDGHFLDYVDRAFGDPVAFPVRARVTSDELSTPVRLVRADTGEVTAEFSAAQTRVVDVSGDVALVATTDASIDLYSSPVSPEDVVWTVALFDAGTGSERTALTMTSREPPRLVGTFSDGAAVVTTRLGDQYPLTVVTPAGQREPIAWLGQRPRPDASGLIVDGTALTGAAVTGDVLAVTHGADGIVGMDRSGDRLWELEAPGTAVMRAGGGHLALSDDEDGRIRVVRASDGEVVARLQPPEPEWVVADTVGLPVAALGGHVGIGRSRSFLSPHQGQLVGTTWLDLRTGDRATVEDVFGRFAGDEEEVGLNWTLHGVVAGEQGVPEPVLSRTQPQARFELLEPGEGFRTHQLLDLPPDETSGVPAFGVASVGATADRFAVWREGVRNPADVGTIVLDRRTGEATTIEGLRGLVLLDDLLLAEAVDGSYAVTALVAVDPATGEEQWRAEPHARFVGEQVLLADDDLVIDPGVARVTARSTRDGSQRWTHTSPVELSGEVVLGPRHVVVASTGGEVVALDRRDGSVAWRATLGTPVAALTGAGDHVVVGTHEGLVVHLDGRGREVQRISVGTGAVHAVAALGETVVAIVDGRVVGLRPDGTGITSDDEVELP